MKSLVVALCLSAAVLRPCVVHAQTAPAPQVDPRIQSIPYDPDQVPLLKATLGYQFMLQFQPGERIETVSIGDSLGWQVTPNRRADVLFIKPIDGKSGTNLTVLTDSRQYTFELQVAPADSRDPILYIARMAYPAPVLVEAVAPIPEPPPVVANAAYGVSGPADLKPSRVFDDGKATYFEWPQGAALPAIFAISPEGREALVNYVVHGPYVVVDQVVPRFVLRSGRAVATVANQSPEMMAIAGKARKTK